MSNEILERLEELGISLISEWEQDKENWYEFEWYSPEGEDVIFCLFGNTDEDIAYSAVTLYEDFDAEQHASEWYGQNKGEPSSLRILLEDAEAIHSKFREIAITLRNL